VPTFRYAGKQSKFKKQIGYLDYEKILEKERLSKLGPGKILILIYHQNSKKL
jgi:hypothetical protein